LVSEHRKLHLKYHGRILDQLGLQTYQSPTACLSELIANSWDADAEHVWITLPKSLDDDATLVLRDDGDGISFKNCDDRYLNVGYGRRGKQLTEFSSLKQRPILGRKGIGKFAGFGIAKKIEIKTISREDGEETVFELDISKLRGEEYIEPKVEINATYEGPDEKRKNDHGTTVTLKELTLQKLIPESQFSRSLARRFFLHARADDFDVLVNDQPIPEDEDLAQVEFLFPRDYSEETKPTGITIDKDGWGVEELSNGRKIRWRVFFFKETIDEEELQGISIFAHGKMDQKPFFFSLSGGLGGQAGQSYMSGQVEADWVDELPIDPISPERQRINWDLPETAPLLEWGQERTKELLREWHDRRGEKRRLELEVKVETFSERLNQLGTHEQKTVKKVLTKLGSMSALSDDQYKEVGTAILTSWEEGRLRELITDIAESEQFSELDLIKVLVEAEVISALGVAEAAKTKLSAIASLQERLKTKDLENKVRDHIAKHPWLVSPRWETFVAEQSVNNVISRVAQQVGFTRSEYKGRVDLVLSSGRDLLVLEFMRPGLRLDWEHINRFDRYVRLIRSKVLSRTGGKFNTVTGLVVADEIAEDAALLGKIKDMESQGMYANDWDGLLSEAISQWKDFLKILVARGKGDPRLKALVEKPTRSVKVRKSRKSS
jgi:Histidine kinase-, DNA gyrase B-, and HSP90-like ATPase